MNELYVVNVSSVQDFYQCRFRWVVKWLMNRVPRNESPALAQGKLLHLIFEDHLTGVRTMEQAIAFRCKQWLDQPTDAAGRATIVKAVEGIKDLAEALVQWKDQYEWEVPVLEVEEPFEIAHPMDPTVRIKGRPDRVGIMHGHLWHVQNRGLAAGMNFGTYMELATRHYHEHVYAVALTEKYLKPTSQRILATRSGSGMAAHRSWSNPPILAVNYGGTMMNLVRKLKYRTNVGKKNEAVKSLDQMFYQHPLSIDLKSPLHEHVMLSLLEHIKEMRRVEREFLADGTMPPPNEKMNGGFNGSTIDPYFRVLTGQWDPMSDEHFKEREDTYAVEEAASE